MTGVHDINRLKLDVRMNRSSSCLGSYLGSDFDNVTNQVTMLFNMALNFSERLLVNIILY